MKEISAGGVVYRNRNGKVEVQLIEDRFGKMTLAKGKMEQGETIEETALREIREETGIVGAIRGPLSVIRYQYETADRVTVQKEVHYYLVEASEGALQAQVEEIKGVAWYAPEESWRLQRSGGYDNNDEVLRQALQKLGYAPADAADGAPASRFPIWTPGQSVASFIDHTLLKAEARAADFVKLCEEALAHRFFSVCVNGRWVRLCREQLSGTDVKVCAVVGFPLGAGATRAKAFEAAAAVEDGASEIDMVIAIGKLLDRDFDSVQRDIASVVQAVQGGALVKVILETGALTDELKQEACRLSEAAGADFVKTSTGFGPGGATEADIRLMRASVSSRLGVKASGGVRDTETAAKMLLAGASRIGTSSGIAIIGGGAAASGTY
ncbi:deoxyribose-phosphate aldolase [Cohnella nanjingensis]|uniref:Deoxyribose-phosphate aldolase n=1 Tax=Cohnella nanjingensis TaxID=1387779 RepID=A0A7X0VIN3_9BACL|nr:deoxyribose-phosphate aldolase [Cohnella nanjingensis]MBB6675382.1 deoxyribose-phosphate aldolase [Cohnella nanjingensis]